MPTYLHNLESEIVYIAISDGSPFENPDGFVYSFTVIPIYFCMFKTICEIEVFKAFGNLIRSHFLRIGGHFAP